MARKLTIVNNANIFRLLFFCLIYLPDKSRSLKKEKFVTMYIVTLPFPPPSFYSPDGHLKKIRKERFFTVISFKLRIFVRGGKEL